MLRLLTPEDLENLDFIKFFTMEMFQRPVKEKPKGSSEQRTHTVTEGLNNRERGGLG